MQAYQAYLRYFPEGAHVGEAKAAVQSLRDAQEAPRPERERGEAHEVQGNKLWEKTYGGSYWDAINSLVLTPDGGALLGGFTQHKGAGRRDMYLVRVDSQGSKLWEKTYGGSDEDSIRSLVLTPDGGALLGGFTEPNSADDGDMYLVRVDSQGTKLWEKTYGGSDEDDIISLVLTPDGGALLGGSTESKGEGEADMYLVRVD